MSEGGWSCPHFVKNQCDILNKACDPGDKGCILYGKAKFSSFNSPSNDAFEKRMERKLKKMEEDRKQNES